MAAPERSIASALCGAAGGTGRKRRSDLPEIPQSWRTTSISRPGTNGPTDNKKKAAFLPRHVLRKRYAACVTLFGICTDVRPGTCRLPSVKAATGCLCPFTSRAKYCERVLDPETGATCKDIAAKLAYAEELKANKAKELYNKMRNRYQMRCFPSPPATRKCGMTTTPGANRLR